MSGSGAAGRSHVYVIESDGGSPTRLTADDENEAAASWSFDGRWIYFSSNKAGSAQIWRIRVPERGTAPPRSAIQVTRNGGIRALESWDGRTLYFSKPSPGAPSLWEMSLATGEEREVLPSLNDTSAFAVFAGGIFFVPRTSLTYAGSIALLSFKDRSISIVAPVGNPILGGMTAHPTGRAVLYSQVDREESDLILSEKVR